MNRIFSVAIAAVILFGCQRAEQQAQNVTTASIEVKTIKCELCVKNVEDALKNVEGVKGVAVDLKAKVAKVEYTSNANPDFVGASVALFEAAIAKAGYDANATKRDETAYKSLPECCQ